MEAIILITLLIMFFYVMAYLSSRKKQSDFRRSAKSFSSKKGLHFEHGGFATLPGTSGDFRGYSLSVNYTTGKDSLKEKIIIELTRNQKFTNFDKSKTDKEIMRSFVMTYNNIDSKTEKWDTDSGVEVGKNFNTILFQTKSPIYDVESISNQLVELIEICPQVSKIGGEIVDLLLEYKSTSSKSIIIEIIRSIARETSQRIKPNLQILLCKKCLTFCSAHKVDFPFQWLSSEPTYFGCRICKQSRDFIEGRPVAVLYNQMTKKLSAQDNKILLNWLMYKKLFDFHEVIIIQASDKEVEEFSMQVGNDTDEFRRPRYKKMPCIVSSDCHLSANTMRLLQHTFHSVKTV